MNRITFIVLYSAGVLLAFIFGNPWLYWSFVFSNVNKVNSSISLALLLSTAVPIFLISIAFFRSRTCANSKLYLFPLFAVLTSAVAFIHLSIAKQVVGGYPSEQSGPFGLHAAIYFGVFSLYTPLILHFACVVIGSIGTKSKRPEGSQNVNE